MKVEVPSWPMVGEVTETIVHNGLSVRTVLDPASHPFLDHHRINGTPVLPGVMGIEAFAEVTKLLAPGWHLVGVEDVRFLARMKFYHDQPRAVNVTATLRHDGPDRVADCELAADRALPSRDSPLRTVHFTGSVRLAREAPEPRTTDVPPEGAPIIGPQEVYRLYFHGPAYRVVGKAWRHGDGAATWMAANLPAITAGPTVVGPRLIELCLQTAGLWEIGVNGRFALPASLDRLRLLAKPVEAGDLFCLARSACAGIDCTVVDGCGRVVMALTGYRTAALPQLLPDDLVRPIRAAMAGPGNPA
jgi:hypothetical protein